MKLVYKLSKEIKQELHSTQDIVLSRNEGILVDIYSGNPPYVIIEGLKISLPGSAIVYISQEDFLRYNRPTRKLITRENP